MSKVITVDYCGECFFRMYGRCIHRGAPVANSCDWVDMPEWCPLPDLPERKEEMEYLATGWNACLDAIREEAEE